MSRQNSHNNNFLNNLIFLFLATIWLTFQASGSTSNFIDINEHDIFIVTPKNFEVMISRQRNNFGVSALLQYTSKEAEHKRFIKDVYNAAASDLKGMVRFGAVDCSQWRMFCEEQGNTKLEYPFVQVFPPNPLPIKILDKNVNKKQLISSVVAFVPGTNVKPMKSTNLDSFISQNVAIPKVLLFSTKEDAPVMFKALSNSFSDRILFGHVPASETTIEKKYKIKSRPAFIMIRSDAKVPDVYDGQFKFMPIHDWINIRAETFVKGGGFTSDKVLAEEPNKPWLNEKVPEFTGASYQDICLKSSSLCVIYLCEGPINSDAVKILEIVSEKFKSITTKKTPSFRFSWLNLKVHTNFAETSDKLPTVIVLNTFKRLRWATLADGKTPNEQEISNLLERISTGDARFTVIKEKKLPSFSPIPDSNPKSSQKKAEL